MANVKEQNVESTLNSKEAFFVKNQKAIIIAVIAIILLIAGVFLYKNYVSEPRENEASTAIAKGQDYFASEDFEKALQGDKNGFAGFAKLAEDYSGTEAGNLAKLYAGICSANLGKWQDAVNYLEAFSTRDDAIISPAAVAALGNAYANLKQPEKAIENLLKAAKMADSQASDNTNNSIAPTFLLQAAALMEANGKKEEALKIYKEIKNKYIASSVAAEIDKYIERASR
ncbi:MAG: tetratricopeptide repeat protein [Prevotella sp.]|nr:tetratricopeptide repeat protein [Prevotella sp.]